MKFIVNIDVPDLDRGIEFYGKALGLTSARRLFDGTVAEMTGGPSAIYLVENPEGSAAVPGRSIGRDYNRHWTPVHLDFLVDNLGAAIEQALAAGAKQEGKTQSFTWGHFAIMSDPFGHGFCLLQFKNKGYENAE